MSSPPSTRPSTSSRTNLHGSQSVYLPGGLMMSSSRPFLNMINPMSRTHQGYFQANQLVVEENENETAEEDLEAGHAITGKEHQVTRKHRVSRDGQSSEMNVLRPNMRKEDKTYEQESDDDVPQRFMIEDSSASDCPSKGKGRSQPLYSTPARSLSHATAPPIDTLPMLSTPPRPPELDVDEPPQTPPHQRSQPSPKPMCGLDDYERALWDWVNVYNLDAFLQEVYLYYEGKGIYSIALERGLNLLSGASLIRNWVFDIPTWVCRLQPYSWGCNYLAIGRGGRPLIKVRSLDVRDSASAFAAFYVWQIISFVFEVMRLVNMYNSTPTSYAFQMYADISTIAWPEIVRRIGAIREENPITAVSSVHGTNNAATPATASLNAHDIANRIMRQENYLVALFNKDLLDDDDGKGRTLTRVLQWNLQFYLMEYLFDLKEASGRCS
ncbi:autophagy protein Apg9-domain-containing protein [Suillus placidus]|uniref:Autophagy-related protein 9 n=1 Tax=Suillus placidus TaxID=48579 RepID=A0A9P6ZHC0_9AGAM|nr:autophagy protein Apg9-domain-containing protein [Suillus placidus]